MKKNYIVIPLVAAIIIIISLGMFLLPQSNAIIRHVDPNQASSELPSVSDFSLIYSSIVQSMIYEQYQNASISLNDLGGVNVPDNVQYTFNRFNSLLDDEINDLNLTKIYADYAELDISQGALNNATSNLELASFYLGNAKNINTDLNDAASNFIKVFGTNSLTFQIQNLAILINSYDNKIQKLQNNIQMIESGDIQSTSIFLNLNTSTALIGTKISADGKLMYGDGILFAGQKILLYIGNYSESTITNFNGEFSINLTVPQVFNSSVGVYALYPPINSSFAGSRSNIIYLNLEWYNSSLSIYSDKYQILPGENFTILGSVNNPNPMTIQVNAFSKNTTVVSKGNFTIILSPPANTTSGDYKIEAEVVPANGFGPSNDSVIVNVHRYPILISITTQPFALGGSSVFVEGTAHSESANISNADVRLLFENEVFLATTDSTGSFSLNLPIPLLAASGYTSATVEIIPTDDRFERATAEVTFTILSPLLAIVPVAALAAFVYSLPSLRAKKSTPSDAAILTEAKLPEIKIHTKPSINSLPGIYASAVEKIETKTGIILKESDTLREYLERVVNKLGKAISPFEELTSDTEAFLYGNKIANLLHSKKILEEIDRLLS